MEFQVICTGKVPHKYLITVTGSTVHIDGRIPYFARPNNCPRPPIPLMLNGFLNSKIPGLGDKIKTVEVEFGKIWDLPPNVNHVIMEFGGSVRSRRKSNTCFCEIKGGVFYPNENDIVETTMVGTVVVPELAPNTKNIKIKITNGCQQSIIKSPCHISVFGYGNFLIFDEKWTAKGWRTKCLIDMHENAYGCYYEKSDTDDPIVSTQIRVSKGWKGWMIFEHIPKSPGIGPIPYYTVDGWRDDYAPKKYIDMMIE